MKSRIYISPSKQPGNSYATGKTNEEAEMTAVAEELAVCLAPYCDVRIATYDLTVVTQTHDGLPGRPWEAMHWGADLYLALHSNARGPSSAGKFTQGAIPIIHAESSEGKRVGEQLKKKLNDLTPWDDTNSRISVGNNFSEVKFPESVGITGILFEVEFHDQKELAEWIIANKMRIAKAIAQALIEAYDMKKKQEAPNITTIPYIVQSGDTLWKIAGQWLGSGVKYPEIKAASGLTSDTITVGQEIRIPTEEVRSYTVKSGDSPWAIAQRELGAGVRWTEIAELNGWMGAQTIYAGQVLVIPAA